MSNATTSTHSPTAKYRADLVRRFVDDDAEMTCDEQLIVEMAAARIDDYDEQELLESLNALLTDEMAFGVRTVTCAGENSRHTLMVSGGDDCTWGLNLADITCADDIVCAVDERGLENLSDYRVDAICDDDNETYFRIMNEDPDGDQESWGLAYLTSLIELAAYHEKVGISYWNTTAEIQEAFVRDLPDHEWTQECAQIIADAFEADEE